MKMSDISRKKKLQINSCFVKVIMAHTKGIKVGKATAFIWPSFKVHYIKVIKQFIVIKST